MYPITKIVITQPPSSPSHNLYSPKVLLQFAHQALQVLDVFCNPQSTCHMVDVQYVFAGWMTE